ncbi:MAG TPA: DUF4340 domain-containing protein [Myxococcota bacterium]|nr:DUF4340 domain-containing protein [Myxococcota bacterium]
MSSRWTFALVALAAALGAWVYFGEVRGDVRKQERETAEKHVFGVESAKVTALELPLTDNRTARLERDGQNGWKLESPVAYPADPDAVERALHVLANVQSTASISPVPSDLLPFGLGPAGQTVRVFTGPGEPQTLSVGRPTPVGGGRYLSVGSDSGRIFTVAAGDVFGLMPALVDLRDKRLTRLSAGAVDDVTVRSGGQLVARVKRAESNWLLVEPQPAPGDVEKIQRMLDELSMARATDFADTPDAAATASLQNPELEIVLHTPEREERLAFGRAGDKTWLERAGDPVLLAVSPAAVSAVPAKTFDYRAKRVQTLESDQVKALELTWPRAGVTHRFELAESDWKSAEPGVELKPLKVEDMLLAVARLDATGIEPSGADRKALGLDPPAVTIRALDAQGKELGALSLGDASPDRGLPAVSSQSGDVWRVSNDLGGTVPLSAEAYTNMFVKVTPTQAAPPAAQASPEK